MADDATLNLKRKASDAATDASSVIKRLRLSTTSEPDVTPTETGGTVTHSSFKSSIGHDNHDHASSSGSSFSVSLPEGQKTIASPSGQVTPFQGASQKGKGKASDLYSESSSEAPPNKDTVLSYPSSSLLNNRKRLSVFRSLPKGYPFFFQKMNASCIHAKSRENFIVESQWFVEPNQSRFVTVHVIHVTMMYILWGLSSGSSSDKQRRRESFMNLTQQDIISISSDSEDEPTAISTANEPPRNGTSQADAIDLTLDLDEDDIIIIDVNPEPLPLKGLHSREFIKDL